MQTFPIMINSWKISFIMFWNVLGLLQSPKNITNGSNSPLLVMNAAFHSSPSLMRMLLYPHLTSNFVKNLAPVNLFIVSPRRGNG